METHELVAGNTFGTELESIFLAQRVIQELIIFFSRKQCMNQWSRVGHIIAWAPNSRPFGGSHQRTTSRSWRSCGMRSTVEQ
eukprot:4086461-Pyramimonas_sp.AAC.1